jgi:hypothetical protein
MLRLTGLKKKNLLRNRVDYQRQGRDLPTLIFT